MTCDVSLLVTAGRGPAECHVAVGAVLASIEQEAEAAGLAFASDVPPGSPSPSGVVRLSGPGARELAAAWSGTVQMVDPTARGKGGRRNFFVAVHRLPDPLVFPPVREEDVVFQAMRAGGPGGQHQNVTDSAVRATHVPTGLAAVARDGRSQHANRKLALARLRDLAASVAAVREGEADRASWVFRLTVQRGAAVRRVDRPS